jgi:AAA domain
MYPVRTLEKMVKFPIFERLDVDGFGLFPGTPVEPGLHVSFNSGLTLFLGANGLGKTTIVTIMFRLLTGPSDISALTGSRALGTARLEPTELPYDRRTMFGQRVSDDAKNATATLTLRLGQNVVCIKRHLADLRLLEFSVDGEPLVAKDREVFQDVMPRLAGVWSFGDWILLLRQLVFYFEDRRALVWDPSAQRQVLRLLLLPIDIAKKWAEDERAVLKLDSEYRNLRATVNSQESRLFTFEVKQTGSQGVRAQLAVLEKLQETDRETRDHVSEALLGVDNRRQHARQRFLASQQSRESHFRELEHAKLLALQARFPKQSTTALYILSQLMASNDCLVCGTHVPDVAASLEARIAGEKCVVCGSDLSNNAAPIITSRVADRRVQREVSGLVVADEDLVRAQAALDSVMAEYSAHSNRLAELDATITERSLEINTLIKRLPPAEGVLHEQRSELALFRGRLEALLRSLTAKQRAFASFVKKTSRTIVKRSDEISTAFGHHAEDFLIEDCSLVWSPQNEPIGQSGESIAFPAFEFAMSAASFPTAVRRSNPDQVSESQREFIDLAFRMALMKVAGEDGIGSLVIDAPESSLDLVFVKRAARVLARFARSGPGNRLVVTSNLVEGRLIPTLLEEASRSRRSGAQWIDLLKIAEPTAAVRKYHSEYEAILDTLPAPNPAVRASRRRSLRSKPTLTTRSD